MQLGSKVYMDGKYLSAEEASSNDSLGYYKLSHHYFIT